MTQEKGSAKQGFWSKILDKKSASAEQVVDTPAETDADKTSTQDKASEEIQSIKASENISPNSEGLEAEENVSNVMENLSSPPNCEEISLSYSQVTQALPEDNSNGDNQENKQGFFQRLSQSLSQTKTSLSSGVKGIFKGKKIDDDLFEELEEHLLVADIGVPTTKKIIQNLTQHASRKQLHNADLLYEQLKTKLKAIIDPVTQPLIIDSTKKPFVILMVGVNGVGKTTTIGKLANQFQQQGKSVMLAGGDTFRAAAVEQLQVWGERNNIPVVAQSTGADSASVIYDAMQSANAKGIDVLIADTAGRLQNKDNLMNELKKIQRVMQKYDATAPHEIMLTLDAGTGQNAISQAKLFHEAVGITGINLTKLDGTAKGGVIFAIADQFKIPIRYIGVGEGVNDLRAFNGEDFIQALFD